MGRPPGALSGNRRRYPQDWELREPVRSGERFQEIDSDEDDIQGVALDPNNFAFRDARQKDLAGDALYLHGNDLDQDRGARRSVYDETGHDDYISDEEGYAEARGAAYARDDTLYRSAMDRIARARVKGKTNVNLSQDEMDALERRRSQQPETPPLAIASPPTTPAKKIKAGSRSSSSTNLAAQKGRPKRSSSLFGPPPAKSNSKAKMARKPAGDLPIVYPPGSTQPSVMIAGPNGMPMYAPLYYPPPSPEAVRSRPRSSSKTSRRDSRRDSRRRESTPPDQAYPPYPPHLYPTPPGMRPDSSSSNRSFQEDQDWYFAAQPRKRSSSSAQHSPYRYPDDFDTPPVPAAHGRRNASGPPDVRHSSLRRVPPSSSPLASSRPAAVHSNSDPMLKASSLRRRETSSSSSSEDQGVQVDILPNENGGYSIKSSPAPATAATSGKSSGNEARKRKPGRR